MANRKGRGACGGAKPEMPSTTAAVAAGEDNPETKLEPIAPTPAQSLDEIAKWMRGEGTSKMDDSGRMIPSEQLSDPPSKPNAVALAAAMRTLGTHTFDLPPKPDAAALADPSRRMATAATRILQDGIGYGANAKVPVDLKTHTDLTLIGAIIAEPWEVLEPEVLALPAPQEPVEVPHGSAEAPLGPAEVE